MKTANIDLPISVGDEILTGHWKNHKEKVKSIGTDKYGQPTVNGRPILTIRVPEFMPKKKSVISSAMIPTVFLAGDCSDGNQWRKEVIDYFYDDFTRGNVILLDPYDENWEAEQNIYWELSDLAISDKIIFYKGGEGSSKEQEFLDKLGRNYEIHSSVESVLYSIEQFITSRKGKSAVELHEGDIIKIDGIPVQLTTPATAIGTEGNIDIIKDALDSADEYKTEDSSDMTKLFSLTASQTTITAYHASPSDFSEFDTTRSEMGAHFSTDKEQAIERMAQQGNDVFFLYTVKLSLQNPYDVISDLGDWSDMEMLEEYFGPTNEGPLTDEELNACKNWQDVQKTLIEQGYDSIGYNNSFESKSSADVNAYIVLVPGCIKIMSKTKTRLDGDSTTACLKKVQAALAYEHGCIMIPAPEFIRTYFLKDFLVGAVKQDQLILDKDDTLFGVESFPHVTVLYGVDHTHSDEMLATIKDNFPSSLTIKTGTELAYFDNEESTAVYVPIDCPELEELHHTLKDQLENVDSHPDYVPHLCLAYLKPGERLANATVKPMEWETSVLVISGKDAHMSSVSCGDGSALTESLIDDIKNIVAGQE